MDRIREKRVWWKQKKFWLSAIGVLFLVMVITMLLGKNVSTVRIEEEKISINSKQKDSTESKQLKELEIAASEEDKQDDKKEEQSES